MEGSRATSCRLPATGCRPTGYRPRRASRGWQLEARRSRASRQLEARRSRASRSWKRGEAERAGSWKRGEASEPAAGSRERSEPQTTRPRGSLSRSRCPLGVRLPFRPCGRSGCLFRAEARLRRGPVWRIRVRGPRSRCSRGNSTGPCCNSCESLAAASVSLSGNTINVRPVPGRGQAQTLPCFRVSAFCFATGERAAAGCERRPRE